MKAKTRRIVRNVLLSVIGLGGGPLHKAHPEWGYVPLSVMVALMATIYGVSFWFWVREEPR